MIKVCKVCGKEFEGKANSTVCSGVCRLEYQKEYQKKYKKENRDYLSNYNRRWYAMRNNMPIPKKVTKDQINNLDVEVVKNSDIIKPKPKAIPDIYKASSWGRKYYKAERLDRIIFLSSALSRHGIAYMSYGQLSAIYESGRYMKLLYQVLSAEARAHETNPQICKV